MTVRHLQNGTDYTVKYENNVKPGTAKITVTGKGNYTGTKTKTFEIVDCVSSLVSGKTYLLIPKNNAKTAVCAIGGKMVNNTKVYITDRGNSESQKFKAVKNSDGTVTITNMLGTVFHLLGNRTVNNTNIHARKAASTTAQRWYLQ